MCTLAIRNLFKKSMMLITTFKFLWENEEANIKYLYRGKLNLKKNILLIERSENVKHTSLELLLNWLKIPTSSVDHLLILLMFFVPPLSCFGSL